MTYYLSQSDWMNAMSVPEGMNLDMINMSNRLDLLLKPSLIKNAKGNIVIDLGCGTGVLGLYALEHGAEFVYFVEQDPQMIHILENVLSKKIDQRKYKIIGKDIEHLSIVDFDCGTPTVAISEFYGPRLFDEGYVNYTKHLRIFFPTLYFIPETFRVDFYLSPVVDYNQNIWPCEPELIEHFKFMYREKGFSRPYHFLDDNLIGSIVFNANTQTFDNSVEFVYQSSEETILVGKPVVLHDDLEHKWTTFGWLLTNEDQHKKFKIHFDVNEHFNPRKIDITNAE